MAILFVVVLLPSALRPPAQQSTQSAEFSPNAPHQNQQSIIAAFQQASSGTAGAGTGGGTGATAPGAGAPGLHLPPPKQVPNFCPNGFGSPPRQTMNIYSGPCAPAWHGNNGGATWQGVTANQIRICVNGDYSSGPSADGPIPDQLSSSENAWDAAYTVFQQYFNQNFQLYGRQIQFYAIDSSNSTSISNEQTAAVKCDQDYRAFASGWTAEASTAYYDQHGIISYVDSHWPMSYYQQGNPLAYSWTIDGDHSAQFTAEFICKQLAGKDAQWAGEADYQHTKRKFGLDLYDTRGYQELGPIIANDLKADCGQDIYIVYSDLDTSTGDSSLGQAATKFKAAGVTTLIPGLDWVSTAVLTNAANSDAYYPEWLIVPAGYLDRNELGSLQNQTEWAHAFGFTDQAMERPLVATDCYRAFQTIDPGSAPPSQFCIYDYDSLYSLITGIQAAGPDLTPANFQKGQWGIGFHYYNPSLWAIGGGFGPGHPTWPDTVTMLWWNPTAPSPDPDTSDNADTVGAYDYLNNGQRYQLGQIPGGTAPFFTSGTTVAPYPTQFGD
ncbi:MAG TPA: ABC transporter substrate-binding protein [Acidimicrobiales bacterium]|nr:ABC transporter substrate-binding protein [Acidimicrobiales bacterium]